MRQRVAHKVVRHLGQPLAVAHDDDRPAGFQRQVVGVGHGVGVPHGVRADALQVDRLGLERPPLIELGQEQEVLDQPAHA